MMWRIVFVAMFSAASAAAQVAPREDNQLLEQLVPESFKLSGSATAAMQGIVWRTTVNYSFKNDSGMNLFLGIEQTGVSVGSCSDAESANGGLPLLPSPRAMVYSRPANAGPPRGIMVLAGAQISGAVILVHCAAPNPGFATAPLSVNLMLGKSADFGTMQTVPVSAEIPVRQLPPPRF